ncbi:MAG: NUDIX hydrolase [Planctomycetota bacterium]|nr:NUDIX hydrolase [Planctomycetota bacterium]
MASKKPAFLFRQSGVVPYRLCDGLLEILLITSIRKRNWIIPKGVVEQRMTPLETALNEAFEEAGVKGVSSGRTLGAYSYHKENWGGTCNVEVFSLRVTEALEKFPDILRRERRWMGLEEALDSIRAPGLSKLIENFPSWLDADNVEDSQRNRR